MSNSKFIIIEDLVDINMMFGIMMELGSDTAMYYCTPSQKQRLSGLIDMLVSAHIEVIVQDPPYILPENSYIAYDYHIRQREDEIWKSVAAQTVPKWVGCWHGTDSVMNINEADYTLFSSEWQLMYWPTIRPQSSSLYLQNGDGDIVWGMYESGGEGIVTGLYHLHQQEGFTIREKSREEKRALIESTFNLRLNPRLPILLYYVGEWVLYKEVDQTLEYLSQYANIIVKPWYYDTSMDTVPNGENIFILDNPALSVKVNSVLRFAVDCVLAADSSGVLITCLLLGLRVIPFYTKLYDTAQTGGYSIPPNGGAEYVGERFKDHELYPYWCLPPIRSYFPSFDIVEFESIRDRLLDEEYWKCYDATIKETIHKLFGKTESENGARKAAEHIRHLMRYGTFKNRDLTINSNIITETFNPSWAQNPNAIEWYSYKNKNS